MLCFHVAQTGKHLLRTQNVSEQNQKHFLCPEQMLRSRANGETFVSATMCPRLPVPLFVKQMKLITWMRSNPRYKLGRISFFFSSW